jgi:hypothetical protein
VEEQDSVYCNGHDCDNMSTMDFLGYHPNKEIAFLANDDFDGFAYYLDSSKLQYLGSFEPVGCCHKLVAAGEIKPCSGIRRGLMVKLPWI